MQNANRIINAAIDTLDLGQKTQTSEDHCPVDGYGPFPYEIKQKCDECAVDNN